MYFCMLNVNCMNKIFVFIACTVLLFSSCVNEFNQVYKSTDYDYKYEYAKACYAEGKYQKAIDLLQQLITFQKGTVQAEESLFMLAMAEYNYRDYQTASDYFRKYHTSYPRGRYAEQAMFFIGESLYQGAPEPRLDQTATIAAIGAFQEYLDVYPDAMMKHEAQQRLFSLQDKLVRKELANAQLYYNLGSYFGNCTSGGNNYEACIITAQNALKDYPYSDLRENFATLLMKSKFELAQQSVEAKQVERFRDAEDECYGFINEYPDSKERATAEKLIAICKKYTQEK